MIARHLLVRMLVFFVVSAACAAAPAFAGASFGIHSLTTSFEDAPLVGGEPGPPDLQAGSHPYQVTVKFSFNTTKDKNGEDFPDELVKDVGIELPHGLIANAQAAPRCPAAVFAKEVFGVTECPADTRVGTLTSEAPYLGGTSNLYNLVPPPGVSVAFGQAGFTPSVIDVQVRNTTDFGATVAAINLSEALPITGLVFTLFGVPDGELQPAFLTMPTSCGEPLVTTVTADSWEHPGNRVRESVTTVGPDGSPTGLSGCDRLHFDPSVSIQKESSAADAPTGLSLDVSTPYLDDPGGLAEASLRDLSIALPPGMSINPATAGGLSGCTTAQIALGQASAADCPNSSKVGSFEIHTAILSEALGGAIYLAQPSGGLFEGSAGAYLVCDEGAIECKIPARLSAEPGSGQLTLTLSDMPELPLANVKLELFGGERAMLANPAVCGTFTATAELTPYSAPESGAPATRSSTFALDQDCGGGFAPSLQAGATNAAAGQTTGLVLHVGRTDGQEDIHRLTATLPSGLLAYINSVALCGNVEAAAGACTGASEVGKITVAAGAGSDPYRLSGHVYLTGPYGGHPYGISLVLPGAAGPFDLGTIVVRGGISVDLEAGTLTMATDPFPTTLQGIPLRVKTIDLYLDRPGLMVNPTSCAQRAITDTVESIGGAHATASAPFRVVGCAALPFAPKLKAATHARASRRGDGAALDVKVISATGPQSNLKSVAIALPKALKARLGAVQGACPAATYQANPGACPMASVMGAATVDTPMLNVPLRGPIYLVYHRGVRYPSVEMVLQGAGLELEVVGSVSIHKGISDTNFNFLPDAPLRLFELNLPRGSHSMLGATKGLCTKPLRMSYAMSGQNGASTRGTTTVAVAGCRKHAKAVAR